MQMAMDAKQKSYMLLPHFHFRPGKQLQLGTILRLSKQTGLPDPEAVLNVDTRVPPPPAVSESFTVSDWTSTKVESRSFATGLWAELSLLSGLGAGANVGKSKKQGLQVKCESMKIEWFTPSDDYIVQSMTDATMQSYLKKHVRPSVYMITGIMIAEKAVIATADTMEQDVEGQFSVDGTQLGVPIKVGPNVSLETGEQSKVKFRSDDPFILAYRLRRFRQKRDGSSKGKDVNKWALFNDDKDGGNENKSLESLEFEDIGPDTAHDA